MVQRREATFQADEGSAASVMHPHQGDHEIPFDSLVGQQWEKHDKTSRAIQASPGIVEAAACRYWLR